VRRGFLVPVVGIAVAALALLVVVAWPANDAPSNEAPVAPEASSEVDAASERLTVLFEGRPSAVAYADDVLWVADDASGTVHHLDATNGEALGPPVVVRSAPIALEAFGGVVWVADAGGTVTRIDAATATVLDPPLELGGALVDVVVDGTTAWVGDIEANVVHVIDLATLVVQQRLEVPAGVVRLARVGPELWVTGLDSAVTPIDVASGSVLATRPVGAGPIGLTSSDGAVWVANSEDDTVSQILRDGSGRSYSIDVGAAPVAVATSATDVWVANQDGESLSRLAEATGSVAGRELDLGFRPRDLVATPYGVWVVGVEESTAVLVVP
jgi:DNA-binding beta-propeller fold protein YncE